MVELNGSKKTKKEKDIKIYIDDRMIALRTKSKA